MQARKRVRVPLLLGNGLGSAIVFDALFHTLCEIGSSMLSAYVAKVDLDGGITKWITVES